MNIFKRIYCRAIHAGERLILPFLPYRAPRLLANYGEIAGVLKGAGAERVLLVTGGRIRALGLTSELERTVVSAGISLAVYDKTVGEPTSANVEEALALYKREHCSAIIAFGGGSAMDCAKATGARAVCPKKSLKKMGGVLKVRKRLPLLIAVPTTAGSGSETTLAAVITDSETHRKYAIGDFSLIPRYALCNPALTQDLPPHITAITGMDALTHAIEAYLGRCTTRKTRTYALTAARLIFENLETAYRDGKDLNARLNLLRAAYLAGLAFTQSYVGYVHAIAHSLGGKYGIPHGQACAAVLPHVLRRYGKKAAKKLRKIGVFAGLLESSVSEREGAESVIAEIVRMDREMGIGTALPEIREEDIPALANAAAREANPLYPVPLLLSARELEEIYRAIMQDLPFERPNMGI